MIPIFIFLSALTTPSSTSHTFNVNHTNINSLFTDAKNFYNILEIEIAFPLEQTDIALFDNPFVIVMTDSGYFLTNDQGTQILKYFPDGSFDRIIARRGVGPGEIQRITFGTRIYNQKIAFWDSIKGSVYIFNQEGDFERELNLANLLRKHRATPIGPAFAWPTEETFILSNAKLLDQPRVQAIVLNLKRNKKDNHFEASIRHSLSFREVDHENKFGIKACTVLSQVESRFWIGSPYFSSFTILNPHKPQASVLAQKKILFPEALTLKDFQDVTSDDTKTRFKLNNFKGSVFSIMPMESLVFVQVGALGFVPFDKDGHQLAEKRFVSPLTGLRDTHKGTAVFVTFRENIAKLERLLNVSLFEESPYDIGDGDQPYIVLMRLREKFKRYQPQHPPPNL